MILNALIWLDIKLYWLICLGHVRPGETMSAAAYSLQLDGKLQGRIFVPVIDFLFKLWQDDHCRKAYQWQGKLYER